MRAASEKPRGMDFELRYFSEENARNGTSCQCCRHQPMMKCRPEKVEQLVPKWRMVFKIDKRAREVEMSTESNRDQSLSGVYHTDNEGSLEARENSGPRLLEWLSWRVDPREYFAVSTSLEESGSAADERHA
jgi:hypothetical protein